jgi:hypothetical protein
MPTKKKPTKRRQSRKWSTKYKKSINCSKPKGFSQKQYCKYGRKKKSGVKVSKKSRRKVPKKSKRKSPKKSRRKVPKKSRRGPYKKRKTAAEINVMEVIADGDGDIEELFEQLSILPVNPTDGSGGGGASVPDASEKTVTGDIDDVDKELDGLFESFNNLSTNSSRADKSDAKRMSETIKKLDKDKDAASSLLVQLNKTREDIAKSACTFSTISSKYIKKIQDTKSKWEQVKQAAEEMNNGASKGKISMQALQNATSVIKEADNVLNKLEKMKEEANKACTEQNRSDAKPVGKRSKRRSPKQKDPNAARKRREAQDKERRKEIKNKQRALRQSNTQEVDNVVDEELALLMATKGRFMAPGAGKLPGVQQSTGPGRMRSTKAIANIDKVLYNNSRAGGGLEEIEMENLEDRLEREMDEAEHAQEVADFMMNASAADSDSD